MTLTPTDMNRIDRKILNAERDRTTVVLTAEEARGMYEAMTRGVRKSFDDGWDAALKQLKLGNNVAVA